MSNRLAESSSPYLLQHAENPVDWYPWGPEALERARKEEKPIFLSIGYSACHWCHVMKRESFEHQETADIINKLYIPIKVDREERPDLDKLYLKSLMLIMGGAGWPMNVWLTPDLKPYHGATYLPHIPKPGMPSLAQTLLFLAQAWKEKRPEVEASADRLSLLLGQMADVNAPPLPENTPWLDEAVRGCELAYDDKHGGFGQVPKFPQPMILRFLLLRAIDTDDTELFELVDHTAQAMGRGGLFDQLGGGFHRYTVDGEWNVPHFEKMLYDNAQLCSFYAEMYAHTKTPFYKWVVDSLVLWLDREMTLENGGFCASTDAESEEEEGRAFVWSSPQLAEIMDENERQMFAAFYNVTAQGNFPGHRTVLTQRKPVSKCAKELGWDFELAVRVLESARDKAFDARAERPQPGRDDKVVSGWNALMTSALCHAARYTETEDAQEMAVKNGEFLLSTFGSKNEDGIFPRIWANDKAYGEALAEDLGALVLAFYDLYELTLEQRWFDKAGEIYQQLVADYWDQEKRLAAQTGPNTQDILLRPYVFEDNPTPSGNSLFLECARRHFAFTGDEESEKRLESGLEKIAPIAKDAPASFGFALRTAHLNSEVPAELVLGGSPEEGRPFLEALQGRLLPHLLVCSGSTSGLKEELVRGKSAGQAYLCRERACGMPCEDVAALAEQLPS
ncbi:MAG: thioredoxin domain-containing protein [Candidatus Eremiobacteraeota bacterium]|nr:thioredoxin domain-containing protein [Candidatus Eremiobacteraeota bacterium]